MNLSCNIIKDLLPSYVDSICSEDSYKVVKEHLEHCDDCRQFAQKMELPSHVNPMISNELIEAKEPFKRINKKRRIQVIAGIIITFMLCIIGALVVQDVGVVNEFFFPMEWGVVNSENDSKEWQKVYFEEKDYVILDSVFWKKVIVNHANNPNNIILRIKDVHGDLIVNEVEIRPGTHVKLPELKYNERYYLEVKVDKGRFFITVS